MIADALSAKLKGLNPCGALKKDFSKAADGSVKTLVTKAQFAKGEKAGLVETVAAAPTFTKVTKKAQAKLNVATASSFDGGNRLLKNLESNIKTTEDNAKYIEENNKKVPIKFDELQEAWLKGDIE
jgi:hypothetical protein